MIFGETDLYLGQVILFSTCPLGQVDLKTSFKPCTVIQNRKEIQRHEYFTFIHVFHNIKHEISI